MNTPAVDASLVVPYALNTGLDVAVSWFLAIVVARRYRGRWRFWLYGLLLFLPYPGVIRMLVLLFVQTLPYPIEVLKETVWYWPCLLAAAFMAALLEESARWLAFRFLIPRRERCWRNALMLGAGNAGLASIGLGTAALLAVVAYLVMTLLPPEAFEAAAERLHASQQQLTRSPIWFGIGLGLGPWYRLTALAIQAGLAVMVLHSFTDGRRWWWYALAAHSLVDFTLPALANLSIRAWGQQPAALATQGLATVYAVAAVCYIAAVRGRLAEPPSALPA
jgi:uncharacterized membrane protein YhfC